jgi:hypothetical protein
VAALPWTVQARISDLAALDGRLYLGVNGYGLASAAPAEQGGAPLAEFRYYYDPLLFGFRTLTALVPSGGAMTCHVYFNSLLNVIGAGKLPVRGLSLLRLHPGDGIYQQVRMPFASSHPGWECVGFAPLEAEEFLLEWKLAEPERSLFAYTRFSLATSREQPAERSEYRQAWEPLEERLPAELEELARELRRASGSGGPLFLRARSAAQPLPRRFAQQPSSRDDAGPLLEAHAFLDGERWFLLSSDGLLLEGGPGGSTSRRLPSLPAGFQYTGLFVLGGLLFAPWEQIDFTATGAAGIFISGAL